MKLEHVSCKYGAPRGRSEYGVLDGCEPRSVHLFKVPLDSGGYDSGGAYWGLGKPLYCAWDNSDSARHFVRAWTRREAADLLEIANELLIRPITGRDNVHG